MQNVLRKLFVLVTMKKGALILVLVLTTRDKVFVVILMILYAHYGCPLGGKLSET